MVGRPSRRAEISHEALKVVREWSEGFSEGREWSGMVRMPSLRVGSGQKTLQKGREWSGGPTGGSGVVGSFSRRAGNGREFLPEGQEWSEIVGMLYKRAVSGWEAFLGCKA